MFISPRHDLKVDETSGRCINGYLNSAESSSSSSNFCMNEISRNNIKPTFSAAAGRPVCPKKYSSMASYNSSSLLTSTSKVE